MSFQMVPLTASPSQTLDTVLGGQFVTLYLQERLGKLFIDVYVNTQPVVQGRICQHQQKIVNEAYRGFIGELTFIDIAGSTDPIFTGLDSRYALIYWDGQNE